MHRTAARTSIPLRFISVVAFATWKGNRLRKDAARTSIPLRFISVVAFATWKGKTASEGRSAHLDSASLHLGRGFRHMEK